MYFPSVRVVYEVVYGHFHMEPLTVQGLQWFLGEGIWSQISYGGGILNSEPVAFSVKGFEALGELLNPELEMA